MSMQDTMLRIQSKQWRTPLKIDIFLDLFADLPTRTVARRLVQTFEPEHICDLIQELQKHLPNDRK